MVSVSVSQAMRTLEVVTLRMWKLLTEGRGQSSAVVAVTDPVCGTGTALTTATTVNTTCTTNNKMVGYEGEACPCRSVVVHFK